MSITMPRLGAALALLLLAVSAAQADDGHHSSSNPSVRIASPAQGFATNAPALNVDVAFSRLPSGQDAELRLYMDHSRVGTYEIPRRARNGTHRFAVNVATRP